MAPPGPSPAPRESRHRAFIERVLVLAALVALVAVSWRLQGLLLLVFAATLVAVILDAAAGPLERHLRLPRTLALVLVLLVIAGAAAAAIGLFSAELREQAVELATQLPAAWRSLQARIADEPFGEQLSAWLGDAVPGGTGVLASVGSLLVSTGGRLTDALVVLAGGIYLAAQPALYRRGLLALVPPSRRALAAAALDDTGRALRLWLGGQLVAMALVGLATGAGLALLGVPSAIALGLIAGVLDFVPIVGPIVAAVPALLIALAQGPETALWTAGLFLLVQQLEGNLIQPIVQQRTVDLPPALLLFSVLAFGILLGVLGVLLAAPLTVAIFVLVKRLYVREALDTPTSIPGEARPH